jgi:C-terminal processing protease CtpA/Prc
MNRILLTVASITLLASPPAGADVVHPAAGDSPVPAPAQAPMLEPPAAHSAAAPAEDQVVEGNPPRRRYGIGMAPPRGGEQFITVLRVTEGDLAAEAGLRVDDRITQVNGRPVSELGAEAFVAAMRGSPLTLVVDRAGETLSFEMTLGETAAEPETAAPPPSPEQVAAYNEAARQLADLLEQRYLFPDVGTAYAEMLRANAAADRYAVVPGPDAFAERLSAELAAVSPDNHLRVLPRSRGVPGLSPSDTDPTSLGVRESGWLEEKIAFVRISMMPDSPAAQEWGDAFMREHADADALILDLRRCLGGTVGMMNGFLPYLYDEPTHLLTMDMRPGADRETAEWFDDIRELRRAETDGSVDRWEHWIEPSENARPELPVFVLTDLTASACEHLAAALAATDRATLIGATTRGAGHFVAFHEFGGGYSVVLPIGRTWDPETGQGWEGVGIKPDVEIDPAEAEAEALRRIAQGSA